MNKNLRIIGIDPGSRFTGVGIIDQSGNQIKRVFSCVIATGANNSLEKKLEIIFDTLTKIIEEYKPDVASIERIFHAVNPRSSLVLGHARGVAMLALIKQGIEINEYTPNEIKSAVVGQGHANKDQVLAMVQILLNYKVKMKDDESDGLAIAICHAHTSAFSRKV